MTTWVLLRGLAREQRHWGAFAGLLQRRLPAGDRVIGADLPGTGTRWRESSPLTVAAIAEAVRAEVRAGGHAGPFVLVALSLGAMTALEWTAQAPRDIRGCVLINSSIASLSPVWERLRPGAWPFLLRWLRARSAQQREQAVYAVSSNRPPDAEVVRQWVEIARSAPVSRRNALRQLFAASRFRAPMQLPVPALVLSSAGDRLVSPRCSQAIAREWNLPLRRHPRAGHDLALDDPQWLADAIADWAAQALD